MAHEGSTFMDGRNRSPSDERQGRRAGAYGALATCRRALRSAGPIELARILNGLTGPDDLTTVLRALEDAADQAAEGGGRS